MTAEVKYWDTVSKNEVILRKTGTWKEINDWYNSYKCFCEAFGWENLTEKS